MSSRGPDPGPDGEDPGGTVRTTGPAPLVVLGVLGLVGGWSLRVVSLRTGRAEPDVGWLSLVLLVVATLLLGGTALLTDAVPREERAQTQGLVDVGVALSGATGGIASGFVGAGTSFATLSLIGGALSLALLPALIAERRSAAGRPSPARADA